MYGKKQAIAVFDSGMGGISVLKELYRLMPNEDFLFFGDSAYAPYGTKTTDEVRERTLECVRYFRKRHAKAVMIACNSATSAAIRTLRELYPGMPLVGLEPAVKPAALENAGKRVLVMATPLTLREEKFQSLVSLYKPVADIYMLPAPGIVELVEGGKAGTADMQAYLSKILQPYVEKPVTAVVLGCTHFPFAKKDIANILGNSIKFYDGGCGAARELKRQLLQEGLENEPQHKGCIWFENSDKTGEHVKLSRRLFEADFA